MAAAKVRDTREFQPYNMPRFAARTVDNVSYLLPHLQPSMTLLDCGCGPGSITLGLARAIEPGEVVGIDLNPRAIEQAQEAAANSGLTNVTFEVGDIYELPFNDGRFDAALAHNLFEHVPDRLAAAKAILRVLRPGGVLGTNDVADGGVAMRGNANPDVESAYAFYYRWQALKGSNYRFGMQAQSVLLRAGFENVITHAQAPTHGTPEARAQEVANRLRALASPEALQVGKEQGWADEADFERWRAALKAWAEHPESFAIRIAAGAIGWKPTVRE